MDFQRCKKSYFIVGVGSLLVKQNWNPPKGPVVEACRRSLWWIKGKLHSCTQQLPPQLSQSFSIHEEVSSMTFGSTFYLQYVQSLQNPHGRTPRAELEGSCCRCDESCRFSLAVHCIPPKEALKPLAGKKSSPESFAGFGNLGGVDQDVAPPGWHLQKFARLPLCIVTTPLVLPDLMHMRVCATILILMPAKSSHTSVVFVGPGDYQNSEFHPA